MAARKWASRSPTFEPRPRYPLRWSPGSASGVVALDLLFADRGAIVGHLDRDLLHRQRQRRLGLRGAHADLLAAEALDQPLTHDLAEPFKRLVAALGRGQRDDVADLRVVHGVLEPVGEDRVAVGDIEGDVELQPLADLALGLGHSVVGVEREAAELDL